MKKRLLSSIQPLVHDRYLLFVVALLALIGIVVLIFLAMGIHPSERQIAVHYTSFGPTNFYRDKWFYLLSFAVYMSIMVAVHILITLKIFLAKGRALALAFAWLGVIMAVVSAALLYQILKIASII